MGFSLKLLCSWVVGERIGNFRLREKSVEEDKELNAKDAAEEKSAKKPANKRARRAPKGVAASKKKPGKVRSALGEVKKRRTPPFPGIFVRRSSNNPQRYSETWSGTKSPAPDALRSAR